MVEGEKAIGTYISTQHQITRNTDTDFGYVIIIASIYNT